MLENSFNAPASCIYETDFSCLLGSDSTTHVRWVKITVTCSFSSILFQQVSEEKTIKLCCLLVDLCQFLWAALYKRCVSTALVRLLHLNRLSYCNKMMKSSEMNS